MNNFIIDETLENYLRPQSEEANKRLKESINEEGVRDPLVVGVLPDGVRVLVDGHHRYSIIKELGITNYPTVDRMFNSLGHIKSYMRNLQLARRNLTKQELKKLILEEVETIKPVRKVVKRFRQSKGLASNDAKPSTETFYQWAEKANLTQEEQNIIKDEFTLKEVLDTPNKKTSEIVSNKVGGIMSTRTIERIIKTNGLASNDTKPQPNPFYVDLNKVKSEIKPLLVNVNYYSTILHEAWLKEGKPDLEPYKDKMTLSGYLDILEGMNKGLSFTMALKTSYSDEMDYNFITKTQLTEKPLTLTEEKMKTIEESVEYLLAQGLSCRALLKVVRDVNNKNSYRL